MNVYTVFDKKSRRYSPPWLAENDSTAQRDFDSRAGSLKYFDDLTPMRIGSFDEFTGQLAPQSPAQLNLGEFGP